MSGKQDIELVNAVVMVTLNIILNFWLVQKYGVLGAAVATGVSTALVNIAKVVEVHTLLGIHPYDASYYKPFIAGVTVVLLFLFSSWLNISKSYWILYVLLLTIVYFFVLCLLGFEHEDKVVWNTVKRKAFMRREEMEDL